MARGEITSQEEGGRLVKKMPLQMIFEYSNMSCKKGK